ncbi:Uu.00g022340.m01.CDS01 [Anthostomella pinea]|uniref:Uu.00g022340.m01.CDS01 n=1 Tax=Anthostomella pinea TaxID=933095 RepID=A0AAI8W0R8_9PEZI|nr:Uu.00g022340.m01.CDS01 [Anthostomella pinea]
MSSKTDTDLLSQATDKANAEVLQSVLKSLCKASEECRKEASKHLLLSTSTRTAEKRKPDDSSAKSPSTSKKQKAEETLTSRYEKCITCKQVFDIEANDDNACVTHEGYLEMDPECFPDDDQVTYEPSSIDPYTDWRRKEWPEGFIWQCCDRACNEEGCLVQAHIAADAPKSRAAQGSWSRKAPAVIDLCSSDGEEVSDEED